jgi:RNA polymerase sigma-70 factor (ECF subfamily)
MERTLAEPLTQVIELETADLYEREAGGLLRYATALSGDRETALDALQEAFFHFFLCRSAGQTIDSPRGWLFRVVRNYVLDRKKAGSRREEVGMEFLHNLAAPAELPELDANVWDLLRGMPEIGLSPREMECVRLRMEDLSYEEIADALGLQSGTVGAMLVRAHGKIRKAVAGRPGNERRPAHGGSVRRTLSAVPANEAERRAFRSLNRAAPAPEPEPRSAGSRLPSLARD